MWWVRIRFSGEQGSPVTHYLSVEVEYLGGPGLSAAVFARPAVVVEHVLCATHRCAASEVELVFDKQPHRAREVNGSGSDRKLSHGSKSKGRVGGVCSADV